MMLLLLLIQKEKLRMVINEGGFNCYYVYNI